MHRGGVSWFENSGVKNTVVMAFAHMSYHQTTAAIYSGRTAMVLSKTMKPLCGFPRIHQEEFMP